MDETENEILECVRMIIDNPKTQFQVFYNKKYVECLSNEQIAEDLGCSCDQVAQMEKNYLRRLRETGRLN